MFLNRYTELSLNVRFPALYGREQARDRLVLHAQAEVTK